MSNGNGVSRGDRNRNARLSRLRVSALSQLSEGIASLAAGDARNWPFGAVLPSAPSVSMWHGWGSQMPAALARAATVLGDKKLGVVATTDSAVFDPRMLTSGGADQALLPTQINQAQIAYGVDSRLESLLATAKLNHSAGLRQLAGVTAAWYPRTPDMVRKSLRGQRWVLASGRRTRSMPG